MEVGEGERSPTSSPRCCPARVAVVLLAGSACRTQQPAPAPLRLQVGDKKLTVNNNTAAAAAAAAATA